MRLTLIAIDFFLLLTLANAFVYRQSELFFHRHAFAELQVPYRLQLNYERGTALWHEAEAAVFTVVVFGGFAYIRRTTGRRSRRCIPCENVADSIS